MKNKILLLLIFILAAVFRFNNLNWDSNFHLHPDERFLTMVGNATKIPGNFQDYLDPQQSTLNPTNVGFPFYVYGHFPLTLNKILAVQTKMDTYNDFTILGRALSALADLLIVLLVYKTAALLVKKIGIGGSNLPLWAAFFYAVAVLPIQLSHFFAVDTFLNLFFLTSFYFALRVAMLPQVKFFHWVFLSAIFFGLALASKATAIFILPLNLFIIIFGKKRKIGENILALLIYSLVSYFTLRMADPYYFQSSNIFNIALNQTFLKNIAELKMFDNPAGWFPPGVQWIHKTPILYSLKNLAFFGLGLPTFILATIGVGVVIRNLIQDFRRKMPEQVHHPKLIIVAILLWMVSLFLYLSTKNSQPMRYFILLYPFFAIFAALGVTVILNALHDFSRKMLKKAMPAGRQVQHDAFSATRYMLHALFVIALLVWPVAFSSIYLRDHSRVEASKWVYQNVPTGALILSEHWDDALPLNVQGSEYGRPGWIPKEYTIQELPVFNLESPEKWQQMNDMLNKGDYYILSSNRGWGSMPTVPERYPRMTKFYEDLFAGKLAYKKIKEFNSFPTLQIMNYKLEIPDGGADESFTVYDHPQVMIFQKQ